MQGYKKIKGYENYGISKGGIIINNKTGKYIKQTFDKQGYAHCVLCKNGKAKSFTVHRLVAITWKPCDNMQSKHVHHINSKPNDNRVSNLVWLTPEEHKLEHKIMREYMSYVVNTKKYKEYKKVRLASI